MVSSKKSSIGVNSANKPFAFASLPRRCQKRSGIVLP